ncbi:uncharacterized protein [Amphiura filiformis]|uniref:uncharacterized protein n=1 Tax=Amphiura filiformis TaxID=82378 RepID=UPI003B22311D
MGLLEDSNQESPTPYVNKKFWGHVKNLKRDGTGVATLQVDGKEMVSGKDKANALSNQYCSVFTTENLSFIPTVAADPIPTIDDLRVDTEGVVKLLHNINPKKASGPDGVPSVILKELSKELAPPLSHIFQQSLDTGDVPADCLIANITAILMKGDKSIPVNYYNRPVSLTSKSLEVPKVRKTAKDIAFMQLC